MTRPGKLMQHTSSSLNFFPIQHAKNRRTAQFSNASWCSEWHCKIPHFL